MEMNKQEELSCCVDDSAEACVTRQLVKIAGRFSKDPQFVLMRIDSDKPFYNICYGHPHDNSRHGLFDTGHLTEPQEKIALIEAIESNRVVIVNDVMADPRTLYMRVHAHNKGIQSIAIVPIKYGYDVRWLMVIDRVLPDKKGFSRDDINFLKVRKQMIEEGALANYDNGVHSIAETRTLTSLFDEYAHVLRNPLTALGGFAHRLRRQLGDGSELAKTADIIVTLANRLGIEYGTFSRMAKHFIPNGHKTGSVRIMDAVNAVCADCTIEVRAAEDVLDLEIVSVSDAVHDLIAEMKNYIEMGMETDERPVVELTRADLAVNLNFKSKVFQAFKQNADFRLAIFEKLLDEVLNGKMDIGEGECNVSFPIS